MAPSPTIRRLLKETQELSSAAKHPNPTFHAAPLSEDNLHEWHFTLLGPPAPSPYAGGIYHGRITLPPAYPMKPPNFRFLTPSGRFEVNREICLSISGFHEETWQPAWGVRLALTALRGFMGEEGTAGQVGGLESPKHIRERLARESRTWRCSTCGGDEEGENKRGWSNEERMSWWWDVCRAKGVNVEAEVEGMESLPDDMKLEARVKEDKGKHKAQEEENVDIPLHEAGASTELPRQSPDKPSAQAQQSPVPSPQYISATHQPASPRAPAGALLADNMPTVSHRDHGRSTSTTTANPPQQQFQNLRQLPRLPERTDSPVTIDRAIAVVLLALCIMILKRVFYPSSGALLSGYDDLRMIRE